MENFVINLTLISKKLAKLATVENIIILLIYINKYRVKAPIGDSLRDVLTLKIY